MKRDLLRCVASLRSLFLLAALLAAAPVGAGSSREAQNHLSADIAAGKPVVVHVVVALCDNDNQGIVPVSRSLGNGQNPDKNLYWGAAYGVRNFLPRVAGWDRLKSEKPADNRILDRAIFHTRMKRGGDAVELYLVADAWDGACIRQTIQSFLQMAAGNSAEKITVSHGSVKKELAAGGDAHLVAYVGHDGLMDFSLPPVPASARNAGARSAIVLACASKEYFLDHLRSAGAHPLLLTTNLMAPEAYTLDAAVRAWIGARTTQAVVEDAAGAYNKYQKCGLAGARRLFWGEP